jgi:hypothetical protein
MGYRNRAKGIHEVPTTIMSITRQADTADADIIGNLIFRYVRKIARKTISFFFVCPSVGLSFSIERLVSHETDFHET